MWLLLATALLSCDPWFSYSPYESRLEETYQGITEQNLELISQRNAGARNAFKVALLSDTHYHFDKLDDAVSDINNKGYFDFVIVTGDIADNGLKQEFVFFHESMKKLNIPYLTVIGNHDYLSNGEEVYGEMFGAYNYTFIFNRVKFVMFDNVRWESEKVPDFKWLETELVNDQDYDHVIPFSHIPPSGDQMVEHQDIFHQLLIQNNIRVSVHGHDHSYALEELYGGGVLYHTISSPERRVYSELTITPSGIDILPIDY
ncbi:MAG: metallophosphoesterase [Chryseosolibacter sp.]